MARGQIAKQEVMKKILNAFGDSAFLYNDGKEIRINTDEEGEMIQIKVALTAAKTAVSVGDDNALPGSKIVPTPDSSSNYNFSPEMTKVSANPNSTITAHATEEEKQNVKDLLAALGL